MTVQYKHLNAGDVLFHRGDQPDFAYLIEQGELDVYYTKDNKDIIIGHVQAGDLLGEMGVLDNLPRTAAVRAVSDCRLVQITADQFNDRIENADPVLRLILKQILSRYRAVASTINDAPIAKRFQPQNVFELLTYTKIRLEAQLHKALEDHELDVRYQPLLDIENNTIVGYEALVRWQHPERGFISPSEFIQLAEETALIHQVDLYVVNAACKAVSTLIQHGASPTPFVAINLSPSQLGKPELVDHIITRIETEKLPEGSLKIELTESQSLVTDDVKNMIARCHEHGIKVALDDFGTGYSNLTQLHEFEFDTIKIDQAFARGAEHNPRSMLLVSSIVKMCQLLGANVLVEGVENQNMLDMLAEQGCQYAQGYHIGKPQTLDEIIAKMQ